MTCSNGDAEPDWVYCSECGEEFSCMDLLVDHHSFDHGTFDAVLSPLINVGDIQLSDGQ